MYIHLYTPCSLGLSATSQQYFSLTTNQPPATEPASSTLLSEQTSISHQPTEQAVISKIGTVVG
jgi:hypothetical protein